MAKVKFTIESNRPKKNGTVQVLLNITNSGSNTTLSTGVFVKPSHFIESEGLISKRDKNHEEYNKTLDLIIKAANSVIKDLKLSDLLNDIKASRIKELIQEEIANVERGRYFTAMSFYDYWTEVAKKSNHSRAQSYKYSLKSVVRFNQENGIENFGFSSINHRWVESYVQWLYNQGYAQNTVWTYYKDLKAVINDAVYNDIISIEILKVLKKTKVKQGESYPFALSYTDLRNILRTEFERESANFTKRVFLFSYCMIGMNLIDIYNLRPEKITFELPLTTNMADDIKLNYICKYKRKKTGKNIRVKLHLGVLNELGIDVHNLENEILFNLHKHLKYSGLKTKIRRGLKDIKAELGINDPRFTFYTARDTWASIASNVMKADTILIDKALSHSTKSLADKHYIDRDMDSIDELNFQVITRSLGLVF